MQGDQRVAQQAPLVDPANLPKYLIRNSDGKFYPYSAALAANSANFTPTNVLSQAHRDELRQAQDREELVLNATRQASIEQEARKRLESEEYERLLAAYMKQQASQSTIQSPEEQLKVDEATVTSLSQADLGEYIKKEFGVTATGNHQQLRDQARILQKARREKAIKPPVSA